MTYTIDFETYEFQAELDFLAEDLDSTYPYDEDTYVPPDSDFEELCRTVLTSNSDHDNLIQEVITRVGLTGDLDNLVQNDLGNLVDNDDKAYYILSACGDDGHATTNSMVFAVLFIVTAVVISGIKLSWKDIGISDVVGNYAEGWLLLPPTAESTFEAVNRRSQRSGVAVLLDGVKLKMISPVRKQSELEQDLESKFQKLSDMAEWADSSWFTYDYHQLAKLLGILIFDFTSSRTFPYLYKTEGGCGGCPPYNNIDTAISGLFKYTRGKSIRAILGVMTETGLIHAGEMSPKDSFFLKSSHIAQMGDKSWVEFTTAYRTLLDRQQLSRVQAKNLVHSLRGSSLPQDYLDLAVEVEMDDATMGTALAHLREDGYLMTELDVRMILNKIEKERAVFGTKPISQVMKDLDDSAALFKANHWKVLTELSLNDPTIKQIVEGMLSISGSDHYQAAWKVMHRYYKIRTETSSTFSSFMYSDTVKVFRTEDIIRMTNRGSNSLRKDFTHTEGMERLWRVFESDTIAQAERRERIVNWLDSDSLQKLLKEPLPDGIGPDDARIYRSFERVLEEDHDDLVRRPIIFIIVSSDKGLVRTTDQLIRRRVAAIQVKNPEWVAISFAISREDYITLCLTGVQEIESFRRSGDDLAGAMSRAIGRDGSKRRIPYYNYLLKREWYYPTSLSHQISGQIKQWRSNGIERQHRIVTEYDYPNLERAFETLEFRSDLKIVTKRSGGYLQRESVEAYPTHRSWAGIPVKELYAWPDFDVSKSKAYRALAVRREKLIPDNKFRIHRVQGTSLYDNIESWRRR